MGRAALAGALLLIGACGAPSGSTLPPTDDSKLAPCGAAPNCVSSDETSRRHGIAPLALATDPEAAWRALVGYLERSPRFEIKVHDAGFLRAEARTPILGFVDDVEFQLRPGARQIAMRSASRIGWSDLGANRRRLEAVRRALGQAGVVESGE